MGAGLELYGLRKDGTEIPVEINLLLTDMIMPDGMTGRDLARQLLTRNSRLKVIYTSGYSADSEGTPCEPREEPAFLQKPYHPRKLA